jgi:hypothetical protein
LLVALILAGCVASPGANQPAASSEAVGPITFEVPAPEDLRDIQAYGFTGGSFYPARPDMHPASAVSPRLESGNYDFEASFRTPFGDQWAIAAVTTARLPTVLQGQEAAYVRDRVRPVVAAWATDGALDTAYTHLPDLGKLRAGLPDAFDPTVVQDEAAILKNVGWPLPYRSEARKEILLFYATGVVLKVKAGPATADEHTVKVSAQQAIQKLIATLHDPNAKSAEEQAGRDYFLGTPFGTVFTPKPTGPYADVGPTFSFSDDAGWHADLDKTYADKPTWWINANGWPGYGRGLVDAQTGAVIRFIRTSENHGNALTLPTPFTPPGP